MRIHENKDGFSILEIIISLAIGLIVLAGLATTFVAQNKAYNVQGQVTEMVQTARAGMDIMGREIQMAGFDRLQTMQRETPGTGFVGIDPVSETQIEIYADLIPDGYTDDANEHITYAFDADNLRITRNTNTGSGPQPFIENVDDFSLEYRDENGNTTTDPAAIYQVDVTLTVRSSSADPDFPGDGYRKRTLTATFVPRNLNITTTTILSTTTTTLPDGCMLDIDQYTVCRGSGSTKYIYIKVHVNELQIEGGVVGEPQNATDADVNWSVASEDQDDMTHQGGGWYGASYSGCADTNMARSGDTYNHPQSISVQATKDGCQPDSIATTSN